LRMIYETLLYQRLHHLYQSSYPVQEKFSSFYPVYPTLVT
jgi:hypothetical protein